MGRRGRDGGDGSSARPAGVPASADPLASPEAIDALPLLERTRELGLFLVSRRSRISPAQVGLPTGARRRVTGLRREEVAVLAGLSPTWYTYLEQGRPIHPSAEVLDALARVLMLSEDERRYLHLLALGRPPLPSPSTQVGPREEPAVVALPRRLVLGLGIGAFPVYAANSRADVLAWNQATSDWFTDFGRLPAHQRNMVWWMFTRPEARARFVDWSGDAGDLVARLRTVYAARPDDVEMARLVTRVSAVSTDFRRLWNAHEVREQRMRPRHMVHPELGARTFDIVILRLVEKHDLAIVAHLPHDIAEAGTE